ncbi:MAG: response regulator, partial [Anaerolineales bacterium]|nr:response regulator [Anaerolineales bacterium]
KATELIELTEALEAARNALAARDGDETLKAPSVEALAQAHRQAVRAANRVGEQLIRDRLELGEITVEPESVSIGSLLEKITADLNVPGAGAAVGTDSSEKANVHADPNLLGRSIRAVLRGAAAAAGSLSGVTVNTEVHGDEVILSISAQDIDLPAQVTPHLVTAEREAGGSLEPIDLELLSLRPFVEAQGGRIWADEPGSAERALQIALPVAEPSEESQPEVDTGNTVLIVDDDPDGAFMLEQVLAKGGYETLLVHDGLSGLQKAKQEPVSLILLDVMLPGMDGFEVCRRLRSDSETADLPIIMISAKSRPEDRETGLKMGADEYMSKPLRLADVLDKVGELLGDQETNHD